MCTQKSLQLSCSTKCTDATDMTSLKLVETIAPALLNSPNCAAGAALRLVVLLGWAEAILCGDLPVGVVHHFLHHVCCGTRARSGQCGVCCKHKKVSRSTELFSSGSWQLQRARKQARRGRILSSHMPILLGVQIRSLRLQRHRFPARARSTNLKGDCLSPEALSTSVSWLGPNTPFSVFWGAC